MYGFSLEIVLAFSKIHTIGTQYFDYFLFSIYRFLQIYNVSYMIVIWAQ